jgi:hypothetical protein
MSNLKLQTFINANSKAKAKIVCSENFCELISFNNYVVIDKFQKNIERKSLSAYFEFIDEIKYSNNEQRFLRCIKKQINHTLDFFHNHNCLLLHRNLKITDIRNRIFHINDLPAEVKNKISNYIDIQHNSIKHLNKKMELSDMDSIDAHIKWKTSKTDLIELATALYDGGFVGAENNHLTKNEFMQKISTITGIELNNHEQTIYKLKSRENRTRFIDNLKSAIENSDYER